MTTRRHGTARHRIITGIYGKGFEATCFNRAASSFFKFFMCIASWFYPRSTGVFPSRDTLLYITMTIFCPISSSTLQSEGLRWILSSECSNICKTIIHLRLCLLQDGGPNQGEFHRVDLEVRN